MLYIPPFIRLLKVIGIFAVSGDRVHISGPDKAQIGSAVSLVCSSQESNPPSVIRWTVDGEEKQGVQEEVSFWMNVLFDCTVCGTLVVVLLPIIAGCMYETRGTQYIQHWSVLPLRVFFSLTSHLQLIIILSCFCFN